MRPSGIVGAIAVTATLLCADAGCSSDEPAVDGCKAVCDRADIAKCFDPARPCHDSCSESISGYAGCDAQYHALMACVAAKGTATCRDSGYGVNLDVTLCPQENAQLVACMNPREAGYYYC